MCDYKENCHEAFEKALNARIKGNGLDYVAKCFYSLESTNQRLMECGGKDGSVCVADAQTAGRGRKGRSFFSPAQSGIYVSVLLRPEWIQTDLERMFLVTPAAAVAVTSAIQKLYGIETQIKWVNDIFFNNKKICGILAEAQLQVENPYLVVGIGLNLQTPKGGFPEKLRNQAGALLENCNQQTERAVEQKAELIAEILCQLNRCMEQLQVGNTPAYMEFYRQRSVVIGRDVWLMDGNEKKMAHVREIDAKGQLLVQYPDGERGVINSGEVSLRIPDVYE